MSYSYPQPRMYMDPNLGIGKVASYQNIETDSAAVGGDIEFGRAVQVTDGVAKQFTDGPFYGVARAKNYVDSLDITPHTGKYTINEMLPVLRKGSITVAIVADVKQGQAAAVDAATANFKPAGEGDTVVGTFKTSGTYTADDESSASTAVLQINLP